MMELKRVKVLLADYYEGVTSREEEQLLMEFFLTGNVPAGMEADRQLFLSLHKASEAGIPDKDFDEKLFAAIGIHDTGQRLPGNEKTDQHISKPQSEYIQNSKERPVSATIGQQKGSEASSKSKQSSHADTIQQDDRPTERSERSIQQDGRPTERSIQQDGRPTELSTEPGGIKRLVYTISGIAAGLLLLAGSYFFLVERQVQDIVSISGEEQYTTEEAMLAYEEAKNALLLVSRVMNTGTEQLEALSIMTEATRDLEMLNRLNQGANELQMLSKFEEAKNKIMPKH